MKKKISIILILVFTILAVIGLSNHFTNNKAEATYAGVDNLRAFSALSWDAVKDLTYSDGTIVEKGGVLVPDNTHGVVNTPCFEQGSLDSSATGGKTAFKLMAVIDIDKDGYITVNSASGTQTSSAPVSGAKGMAAYGALVQSGTIHDQMYSTCWADFWYFMSLGLRSSIQTLGFPGFAGYGSSFGGGNTTEGATAIQYENGQITDKAYVGKVFIFFYTDGDSGGVQDRAVFFGSEDVANKPKINKYVTKIKSNDPNDPGETNLGDQRENKTDREQDPAIIDFAESTVYYKIKLENTSNEIIKGVLTDEPEYPYLINFTNVSNYTGDVPLPTGGNSFTYITPDSPTDTSSKTISVVLQPGEKREYQISLDLASGLTSGKYKNTIRFTPYDENNVLDPSNEITSTDWVIIPNSISPINKYIESIDGAGQSRSSLSEPGKVSNPADAGYNDTDKTIVYKVELENKSIYTITGIFRDVHDGVIQIQSITFNGTAISESGTQISIPPRTTLFVEITATVPKDTPEGTYVNTAYFKALTADGEDAEELESSDFFKLKKRTYPPAGKIRKYVTNVQSPNSSGYFRSGREAMGTTTKEIYPAEVEKGSIVTYRVEIDFKIWFDHESDADHQGNKCSHYYEDRYLDYIKCTDTFDSSELRFISISGASFGGNPGDEIIWNDVLLIKDQEQTVTADLQFEVLTSNMRITNIKNAVSDIKYQYTKNVCDFIHAYDTYQRYSYTYDDYITVTYHDYPNCDFSCSTRTEPEESLPGTDAEYLRVLDPIIAGDVYLDLDGDDLKDPGEELDQAMQLPSDRKVVVELWNATEDKKVDEQQVSASGHYDFGRVRKGFDKSDVRATQGTEYTHIGEGNDFYYPTGALLQYYVVFDYNGVRYEPVNNHDKQHIDGSYNMIVDFENDSNADDRNRPDFEKKLTTIANNKSYDTEDSSGNKYTLAYDTNNTSNLQISTYTWDKSSGIYVEAQSFTFYYPDGEVDYLQHINLGLKDREKANLSLTKDVVSAQVTVNGFDTTYTFEKLGNSGFTAKSDNTMDPYVLRIYREDYEFRTANYVDEVKNVMNANNAFTDYGRTNDLEIIITYKITIKNESDQGRYAAVKEVVDYYSNELTFLEARLDSVTGATLNSSTNSSFENSANCPSKCNVQFLTGSDLSNKKLAPNDTLDIYSKYKVLKHTETDKQGYIYVDMTSDNAIDAKVNVAEVGAYSIYKEDGTTPAGLIDVNSNPANVETTGDDFDTSKFEDDTFETALKIVLRDYPDNPPPETPVPPGTPPGDTPPENNPPPEYQKKSYRNISGIVFEELAKTASDDGQKVGDGKMSSDTTKDTPAANVLVKLYEVVQRKSGGNVEKEYLVDTGMWYRTGSDGRYYFGDCVDSSLRGTSGQNSVDDRYRLHAGIYVVRFVYGDEADFLVTSDGTTIRYSGQDFKSTKYTDPGDPTQEAEIIEATAFTNISGNSNPFSSSFQTTLGSNIVSVAKDNEIRRLEVNEYSTTMTYPMDTVLKAYDTGISTTEKENDSRRTLTNIDEAKILAEHTSMFADTKAFNMQIEYFGNYGNASTKTLDGTTTDPLYYSVRDVNFGLIERPITKLQLMNDITEVRAITSDGNTLIDIFFKIIYEDGGDKIIHRAVPDLVKSKGLEQVQVLNRFGTNQGFRYVNVDDDLLQGMTITIKFQTAIANNSDIDHISTWLEKKIEGTPGDLGSETDLHVVFDPPSTGTSTSSSGVTKTDIINTQTRNYDYSRNYLHYLLTDNNRVGQIGGDGTATATLTAGLSSVGGNAIYNYAGQNGVGSNSVKKAYTYTNIRHDAQSNYTAGYYVGDMYYNDTKTAGANRESIVKTRVNQYIDYVDNDLVFKPEENFNENNQVTYQTYSIDEIAEKGLLRGIDPTVQNITDGEKNYVSRTENTNNNLAFNIEDASINPYFYKFLEPFDRNKFNTTISEASVGYDYDGSGTVGDASIRTLGNPLDSSYENTVMNEFYFIRLEASKILTSEVDINGVVLDNIAEIIKVSNTVGRKAYVKDDLAADGFIGNTTKEPIAINDPDPSRVLPKTLIELARPESDTDFSEYVTFSPPTGISETQRKANEKAEQVTNVLLIAIPAVIIVLGVTYVTVEFVRRKKFYK